MLNTNRKSQSTCLLNSSLSTPNLFSKPLPVQKDPNPFHHTPSKTPSNINSILSSLIYFCCRQKIIKTLPSGQIAPIDPVYLMPCGHHICDNCIMTVLQRNPNSLITCPNKDCSQRYNTHQAEISFIKNHLITSFVEKLCKIQRQQNSKDKKTININSTNNWGVSRAGPKPSNCQNLKIDHRMQVEIDKEEQISDGSSESLFHECVNTFCRRPTKGFFCSNQCQQYQEELDRVIVEDFIGQNGENQNHIII